MSLIVSIIRKDQEYDTEKIEKEIVYPHNNLFGFESCRETFWGHSIMESIGCNMIHSLKYTNVYAFDDDLEKLKNEFQKLHVNMNIVMQATNCDPEWVEFRVNNALEYIKVAEKYKDKVGVALW